MNAREARRQPRLRHGVHAAAGQHQAERPLTSPQAFYTELIIRIGLRDRRAFSTLYDEVASTLFAVILRRGDDPTTAELLLEQGFLNIWRNAPGFRPQDNTVNWLLGQPPTPAVGSSAGER